MFKINEDVIHKSAGACIICDIITQNFGVGDKKYYYIKPKYPSKMNKTLEIYLPVEKENDFLRKPISKADVLELIDAMPNMEKLWINDARARKQMFEEIYHSGDVKGLCKLVKLLYINDESFNKPMSITDKNFLTKIKHNIFDEFAVVLEIHPDEVEQYIKNTLDY